MSRFLRPPILFLACCCSAWFALAQTTILSGRVTDALTGQTLVGATVQLSGTAQGTSTDSTGRYQLAQLRPGFYNLEVSFLGYRKVVVPEVLLNAGTANIVDVALHPAAAELSSVVVSAPALPTAALPGPRPITLTTEAIKRLPATFYDPARMAALYAGVGQADDQANALVIRGHTPNHLKWRLEGFEITNPNHTANAGTFSDLPTLTGGGVNALSAQVLDNSVLHTGAWTAEYGNAVGGILDMRFRNGDNEDRHYTLQAGLIGFDAAAEGPFRAGGKSSYLVNARYSFTGLLAELGIDFGGETISFSDLSYNLFFPIGDQGSLKVFGLFGESQNRFTARPPEEQTEFKDLNDIDFTGSLGNAGFRYEQALGERGRLDIGMLYSTTAARRDLSRDSVAEFYDLDQTRASLRLNYRLRLGARGYGRAGLEYLLTEEDLTTNLPGGAARPNFPLTTNVLQPYLAVGRSGGRFNWELGVRVGHFSGDITTTVVPEPRLRMSYLTPGAGRFALAYGLHTQREPGFVLARLDARRPIDYAPLGAHHLEAEWEGQLSETKVRLTPFYQQVFNQAGGSTLPGYGLQSVNLFDDPLRTDLFDAGFRSRHYGLEATLQRYLDDSWYYLASAGYFRAELMDLTPFFPDFPAAARFDGRYTANLTLGREWEKQKTAEVQRTFGFNLALIGRGGYRQPPIDLAASRAAGRTVFVYLAGYTEQLRDYFRADLRIYWRRNRGRRTATFSLDLQNALNTENTAYFYYDALLDDIVERRQLTFIPILNYRLELSR